MKKINCIIIFFALFILKSSLFAQNCAGVTTTTFVTSDGQYNNFGVKVTLDKTNPQDIIVKGSIFEKKSFQPGETPMHSSDFIVTVAAGKSMAETVADFFQIPVSSGAEINIVSVSPCPFDYNQLAMEHNDALDYLHLNYSTGGPYDFHQQYDLLLDYCRKNNKPLPILSYQQMIDIKNQVTDIPELVTVLQSQFNFFTINEKNEMISLYKNLSVATNDEDVEGVLQNFDDQIKQSFYSDIEKEKLLSISPSLHTIGDFWATTDDFMQHPGEKQTWAERVLNDQMAFNYSQVYYSGEAMWMPGVKRAHGPMIGNGYHDFSTRRCRLFCVICVALHDVAMTLATNNPVAGALWSLFARCCICRRCGNTSCTGDK